MLQLIRSDQTEKRYNSVRNKSITVPLLLMTLTGTNPQIHPQTTLLHTSAKLKVVQA
jgi:hypothetical protein